MVLNISRFTGCSLQKKDDGTLKTKGSILGCLAPLGGTSVGCRLWQWKAYVPTSLKTFIDKIFGNALTQSFCLAESDGNLK